MIFDTDDRELSNKTYKCREIDCNAAKRVISTFHYSGGVVYNSTLHLGVFDESGALKGALSFGYPMNPEATPGKICPGTTKDDMYELNRMAMDEDQPRNSESQAISLCLKYVRKYQPDKKWILSFSDGKEGNVGYIYQATNWLYLGYYTSNSFFDLDGDIVHAVTIHKRFKEAESKRAKAIAAGQTMLFGMASAPEKTTNELLFDNYDNVSKIKCKQHIYVMPLKKNIKFFTDPKPYPKLETEERIIERKWLKKDGVIC